MGKFERAESRDFRVRSKERILGAPFFAAHRPNFSASPVLCPFNSVRTQPARVRARPAEYNLKEEGQLGVSWREFEKIDLRVAVPGIARTGTLGSILYRQIYGRMHRC